MEIIRGSSESKGDRQRCIKRHSVNQCEIEITVVICICLLLDREKGS